VTARVVLWNRGMTMHHHHHDLADRFVATAGQPEDIVSLAELERRYILRVIGIVEGNKSRAAQLLGLDRRTLYRKLDRYRRDGNGPELEAAGFNEEPSHEDLESTADPAKAPS
jgi:DNA-binding NtrC family response regulator